MLRHQINSSRIAKFAFTMCFVLSMVSEGVFAVAVQWSGNGHFYEAVYVPEGITFADANLAAIRYGANSHLATISSAEENRFVYSLIQDSMFWIQNAPGHNGHGPWIGGIQTEAGSEPKGGWRWVTDEPWQFTNWSGSEPNDSGDEEDGLAYFNFSSSWNDYPLDGQPSFVIPNGTLGYVVESVVPLPATIWLMGPALVSLFLLGRRKGYQ
jgi:hypothetical protein